MAFRVGMKVVCIRTMPVGWRIAGGSYPEERSVYTIRSILPYNDTTLLRFFEIDNSRLKASDGFVEPGFNSKYFRPVVERKTDISIFTAMLDTSQQGVDA